MAKKKVAISLKNCEIVFGEELEVIEREKNKDDVCYRFEDILRQFEGVSNLSISISTDSDI